MTSQVCETLAFINGDDGVSGMEVMEINGSLLTSLMEEPPSDENDDDRLDSLIRSFESEISGSKMEGQGHDLAFTGSELVTNIGEDNNQLWNMGQMDGQDCWASSSEFGVEWVDMDLMPSSPCDDRSWFIEPYGDEKDGMDGFVMGEHGFNSFWQDSYNLVN